MRPFPRQVDLSLLCPAHNEQENITPLVEEVMAVFSSLDLLSEFIIADDASTDATPARLQSLVQCYNNVRVVRLPLRSDGRGHGQSAAFHAAIRVARGRLIAMIDADLQNDPADLPAMLAAMRDHDADLVQGDRSHARNDSLPRRISSRVGRFFRLALLNDTIRDTGCSLRIMERELALRLPLEFRGMHRFIPFTARHMGYRVIEVPVNHRPRVAGTAKYGVWNRAIPGLIDCFAVRWMVRRRTLMTPELMQPNSRESAHLVDHAREAVS